MSLRLELDLFLTNCQCINKCLIQTSLIRIILCYNVEISWIELGGDSEFVLAEHFSIESKLLLSRIVNKPDFQIWGLKRLQQIYQALQRSHFIVVWRALLQSKVMVPHFFEIQNVTGECYKNALLLRISKLWEYSGYITFQLHGAPPQFLM